MKKSLLIAVLALTSLAAFQTYAASERIEDVKAHCKVSVSGTKNPRSASLELDSRLWMPWKSQFGQTTSVYVRPDVEVRLKPYQNEAPGTSPVTRFIRVDLLSGNKVIHDAVLQENADDFGSTTTRTAKSTVVVSCNIDD